MNSITKCEKQTESTIFPRLLLPLCNFNEFCLWHQIQNMQCNDFFFQLSQVALASNHDLHDFWILHDRH